jgi:hypothetical protein
MRLHDPLARIWIIDDVGGRVVSDDIKEKVVRAGILELVRLSGWANESIASSDGCHRIACSKLARPAEDKINLPLRGMSMKWIVRCAGRQFGEFDIEGVPATRNANIAGCAKGLGDVTAKKMKTSAWRTNMFNTPPRLGA